MLTKIDRFGIEAILGRKTFYYGELRRLICAENIHRAYHGRKTNKNWAEWSATNPGMATLLIDAEKLAAED